MPNKWVKFVRYRSLGRSASLRAPYPIRYVPNVNFELNGAADLE